MATKKKPPTKAQLAKRAARAARGATKRQYDAWSRGVRTRAGMRCEICGCTKSVQAHHLLPRKFYPLFRFDWENGVALCARHHKYGPISSHEGCIGWVAVFARMFPTRFALALSRVDMNSQADKDPLYVRAGATMQAGHTERGMP